MEALKEKPFDEPGGTSNFYRAFNLSFDVFQASIDAGKSNGCSRTVVIFTDGMTALKGINEYFLDLRKRSGLDVNIIVFRITSFMERSCKFEMKHIFSTSFLSFTHRPQLWITPKVI